MRCKDKLKISRRVEELVVEYRSEETEQRNFQFS